MSSDSELIILRQLLLREQAFFDIENQQTKVNEKDSFNSIQHLIHTTRTVYSLHLSLLEQLRKGIVLNFPDIGQPPKDNSNAQFKRALQISVSSVYSSIQELAKNIQKFLDENPALDTYIAFSFLPALFSCFWSKEEAYRFNDLIFEISEKYHHSLVKVVLVHPAFFVFLSSIQSDAQRLLNSQQYSLDDILNLFKSRQFLFPASIKDMISKAKKPAQFFLEHILEPLLMSPSFYGLVPPNEFRNFKSVVKEFNDVDENKMNDFIDSFINQECTIQSQPSEADLTSAIAANDQFLYFLKMDCQIVQMMADTDTFKAASLDNMAVIQINAKRITPLPQTKQGDSSSEEDPFETILRSLVLQFDVFHQSNNIIEIFDSALTFHAGASRLQLELQLDEFKQMKKQRDAPDDVSYYINILTSAYELRMKHRRATLSNSMRNDLLKVQHLQCTQAIQYLIQSRDMNFFYTWEKEIHPFDTIEADIPDICTNKKNFPAVYKTLISMFMQFSEEKKFGIKKEQCIPIVYNKVTQIITLSEFMKYNPKLTEIDEKIHDMIRSNKDSLFGNNQLPFLKAFQENPDLMGLSADHLKRAFEENSIIPIAEWIDKALNAIINILSFQGYTEIGGDHWLPMTLLLFLHVNPSKIASVASYLHQFLLELPDSFPVSQSVNYNVTMIYSAFSYFQAELEKY